MRGKKQYLLLIIIALLVIASGYIRDYLFIHINYRLSALYYKFSYDLPSPIKILQSLNYTTLYYFKFALTLLFILIYLAFTVVIVKILYENNKFVKYTFFAFGVIFLLSGLSYLYGYLFNDYARGYHLSRVFAGLLQSPVIIMILVPAFKLSEMRERS